MEGVLLLLLLAWSHHQSSAMRTAAAYADPSALVTI